MTRGTDLRDERALGPGEAPGGGAWFRRDLRTDRTFWSDDLFRLFGYLPGEVVPSAELSVAHIHPCDRGRTTLLLSSARISAECFTQRHRVVRTDGAVRLVVMVVVPRVGDDGRVDQVSGFLTDLSEPGRLDGAGLVAAIVREAALLRRPTGPAGSVDRATAVLMRDVGCTADEANALLTLMAHHACHDVRGVAERLVGAASVPA